MKLKELHIRNIASIERADIDFEHGLNDAVTGEAASIFLISGDTGAGKSVILDCISMALYKRTPRIASVANVSKNEYTNADGEQLRVASIEQYTRLGISDKDESYSEVVFVGNDNITYHARLQLGMGKAMAKEKGAQRPLKHRKPRWELRIGDGDWTKDSVEETILRAVGLDFQQFGRMAMLAQGQFANFLTGDKKEREAILEQLTNTQLFSAYGEAIASIHKDAKSRLELVQTRYEVEKPHTLGDEEAEQLRLSLQADQLKKESKDKLIAFQEERLKQVDNVLRNEAAMAEATAKKLALEAVVAGDEYQRQKQLFIYWDSTTRERHLLSNLQRARKDEQTATASLIAAQEAFNRLSADMAHREAAGKALAESVSRTQAWIDERKRHESLFARAGETDMKMAQYLTLTGKARETDTRLRTEQERTASLVKAVEEATARAQKADKAVEAKEAETEALIQQRKALNPQSVNEQLATKESTRRALEDLRKAYDMLHTRKQEANAIREEVRTETERLAALRTSWEQAEALHQQRQSEASTAEKRLTTMRMSVNDTIVALRRRLLDERTETCPLCGGQIDPAHLTDDFKGMLSPLEKEHQEAAAALKFAISQRDAARDAFVKFEATLQSKNRQLEKADKQNTADGQSLESHSARMGLDVKKPLAPQIDAALAAILDELARLKKMQQEAERIQGEIDKQLKARRPLDKARAAAAQAKSQAENGLKANRETILRLTAEYDAYLRECEDTKSEVSALLSGYADEWLTATEAIRQRLKDDAREYASHQRQLSEATAKRDQAHALMDTLARMSNNILQACPSWQMAGTAVAYSCKDIAAEWTALLSRVTALTSKLVECQRVMATSAGALDTYYHETDTTEQTLLALIAQESEVTAARKFVGDTDSQLKSRNDAIAEAQRQIALAMGSLGVADRSLLPEKQQMEDERAVTMSQRDDILRRMAQTQSRIDTHLANIQKLKAIEAELEAAKKHFARWDKLNSIFGGTRFRTLVQTYILRPLLNNANIYLQQITDRYRLTCSQDNEQLSILVLDRYNKNQVRSVTVLSGGERFMISLALSLALSSLNRPDMNVDILFIDEGFGTLDEKSLDSVMATLERLQEIAGQTHRRVGIISHREELDERIPVKIQVVRKGEGRSMVEVRNAF